MTNLNKSTLFHRKVRNQVLRKNQRIDYTPKYYIFEKIGHCDYTFLNKFFADRRKTNKRIGFIPDLDLDLDTRGPKDYPWKNDTKCCFFGPAGSGYSDPIFVLPHDWLSQYDPTIPILGYTYCYLDLEKKEYAMALAYLIRDRFHLYPVESVHYPCANDPVPYSIRKGDEDWCITYLNFYHPHLMHSYFRSFLLIKNIDFSEFDAQVEAKGLKCPLYYDQGIKIKDNSQSGIEPFTLVYYFFSCVCIDCRKDYRTIEVGVILSGQHGKGVNLYFQRLIK